MPGSEILAVLLLWSAVWSIAAGIALIRHGKQDRAADQFRVSFWAVNCLWQPVNVAVVAWALFRPAASMDEVIRVLRFNAGLDLLYLLCGLLLLFLPRPASARAEALKGAGAAVIIQSIFLLLLDWLGAAWLEESM